MKSLCKCQTRIPILENLFGESDLSAIISVKYVLVSLTWLFGTRLWRWGMKDRGEIEMDREL